MKQNNTNTSQNINNMEKIFTFSEENTDGLLLGRC